MGGIERFLAVLQGIEAKAVDFRREADNGEQIAVETFEEIWESTSNAVEAVGEGDNQGC